MRYQKLSVYAAMLVFGAAAMAPSRALGAPGDLDLLFGINGKVITSTGVKEEANAVAIQADGKIVIVGSRMGTYDYNGVVARYNTDGSVDASFGTGGFVVEAGHGGHTTYFRAVDIQPDGKIVVAGDFFESGGCPGRRPWVLRYNADGSRDNTFGGTGAFEFFFFCQGVEVQDGKLNSLTIQPDGKIVVAGSAETGSLSLTLDFAVARLTANGEFDTTFSADGMATYPIGSDDEEAFSVAFHPRTGKIIVAGYTINSSLNKDFGLIMLNSNGSYDTGFGFLGRLIINFAGKHDQANAVAFQPDGKILAGGYATYAPLDAPDQRFALARFTSSGSLDSTFGNAGKVTTNFGPFSDSAGAIALQSDAKIVAVGWSTIIDGASTDFALARYHANGTLDKTFGGYGMQTTDFMGGPDYARAVAIQSDGKIVAAGSAANGLALDIAISRYEP